MGLEYLIIKDIQTGRTLQVLRQPPDTHWIAIEDITELADIKNQSIGKVIRNWMEEVKK